MAFLLTAILVLAPLTVLFLAGDVHDWGRETVKRTQLLAGTDSDQVLRQLVHHAREILGGDGAGVCVPTDDPAVLRLVVAEGSEYERWVGELIPVDGSVSGSAIAAGRLVVVGDPLTDPRTTAEAERAGGLIGETVAVPLLGDGGVSGW